MRPLHRDDGPFIFDLFSDEEVIKYYDLSAFTSHMEADNFIAKMGSKSRDKTGFRLLLIYRDNEEPIGTIGINRIDKDLQLAVIGYDLLPSFWGRGIMTEAISSLVSFLKSSNVFGIRVKFVQADVMQGNKASERVLTNTGFYHIKTIHNGGHWQGAYHTLERYELKLI